MPLKHDDPSRARLTKDHQWVLWQPPVPHLPLRAHSRSVAGLSGQPDAELLMSALHAAPKKGGAQPSEAWTRALEEAMRTRAVPRARAPRRTVEHDEGFREAERKLKTLPARAARTSPLVGHELGYRAGGKPPPSKPARQPEQPPLRRPVSEQYLWYRARLEHAPPMHVYTRASSCVWHVHGELTPGARARRPTVWS